MRLRKLIAASIVLIGTCNCLFSAESTSGTATWRAASTSDEGNMGPITLDAGTYAVFHTSDGDYIAKLYDKEAPKTVENFVGLATGKKKWTHPITRAESSQPLYNNTTIYEIIKDIVIRGGDPIEKGTGDPGYSLDPEISPNITFSDAGMLAMQKSGSKANGSRWFIALMPFPDWSGQYTIFGKVIGGLDVVRAISHEATKRRVAWGGGYVPLEPVLVNSIEIVPLNPGQRTTATFALENGKKVLTIEKNFQTVATPRPTAVRTTRTSGTVAGAGATTGTADNGSTGTKTATEATTSSK